MKPAKLDFTRVDDDGYPVAIILKQNKVIVPMTGRTTKIIVQPNTGTDTVEVTGSVDIPTATATYAWSTIAPLLSPGSHFYQIHIEGGADDPLVHTEGWITITERLPAGTL